MVSNLQQLEKFRSQEEYGNCQSRLELSNAYLVVKIGVDTEENGPFEVRDRKYGCPVVRKRIRRNLGLAL